MIIRTLRRFIKAQEKDFYKAYIEIKYQQKKVNHWIWYIFPQLEDLGYSEMAKYYGLKNFKEAKRYYKNKTLRKNLLDITKALLEIDKPISEIVGIIDAKKIQSCMTLFYEVSNEEIFKKVIDKFYNGEEDENTLRIIG